MFEKIGFDVIKLQRVAIGRLKMPGSLKRGEYVFLTEAGLKKIFEGERKEAIPIPRKRSAKTDARAAGSRTGKGASAPAARQPRQSRQSAHRTR
jgi:23S rRNA pseudouridine2605 synthase